MMKPSNACRFYVFDSSISREALRRSVTYLQNRELTEMCEAEVVPCVSNGLGISLDEARVDVLSGNHASFVKSKVDHYHGDWFNAVRHLSLLNNQLRIGRLQVKADRDGLRARFSWNTNSIGNDKYIVKAGGVREGESTAWILPIENARLLLEAQSDVCENSQSLIEMNCQ